MVKRLQLHHELLKFLPIVYFQPPSNIQMNYPCIIYTKTGRNRHFGNDVIYLSQQGYQITVVEENPDSTIAEDVEKHFQNCVINQNYTIDNLYHTTLSLYY